MTVVHLPKVNELGFFEIRLESIGGLGANLAGKMLAEAGVNGVSFSSYGSEKKGSPVKAHIRFSNLKTTIHDTVPVERPHFVSIFHEALAKTVNVVSGTYADSIILINSEKSPEQLKGVINKIGGIIAVIDATGIALAEKNRINMAIIGAMFRLCPFLDPDSMKVVIRKSLGTKYPQSVNSAINTFDRGYNEVKIQEFSLIDDLSMPEFIPVDPSVLGIESQSIGG